MTFKISSACLMSASLILVALVVVTNAEKSPGVAVDNGGKLDSMQGVKVVNSETKVKTANLEEVANSNPQMEIEAMFEDEMDDEIEHDEENGDEEEDEEDEEDEDVDGELELADREDDIDDEDDDEEYMDEDEEENEEEGEGDMERIIVDSGAGITGASGPITNKEASIETETGDKKGTNLQKN